MLGCGLPTHIKAIFDLIWGRLFGGGLPGGNFCNRLTDYTVQTAAFDTHCYPQSTANIDAVNFILRHFFGIIQNHTSIIQQS